MVEYPYLTGVCARLMCRFRGTYCGQDVAIKILKTERLNDSLQQEFAQEVFIMRYSKPLVWYTSGSITQ